MIQINLLPDIKQELIKAQRVRNYVISLSIVVGLASIGIAVILGLLVGVQLARDRMADEDIDKEYDKLSSTTDVTKVITMQNQLTQISILQDKRSMNSRMFDVLLAVNPPAPDTVKYITVKTNLADKTLTVEGTADNYNAVDALKKSISNAKLSMQRDGKTSESSLVNDVKAGDTSVGDDAEGKKVVRFSLTLSYVDGLFDNSIKKAEVVLPQGRVDVTDSRKGVPASLFTSGVTSAEGGKN